MNIRIWLFALLAMVAVPAMGQSPQQVRKQAEASMVVTGHVDIEADGSISAHHIDRRARLPDYVVSLVDRAAQAWRFEPLLVDGEAVPARARMSLRLLARPVDGEGDEMEIVIANGSFGEYSDSETDHVTRRGELSPPRYPNDMARRGAEGTVYLLIKVGREGDVEDVVAERVNLRSYDTEGRMERMRNSFANRTISVARDWKFNPPTTGEQAGRDFWVVRIPVDYSFRGNRSSFGQWVQYVPGPLQEQPDWLPERARSTASDAMIAGGIQMVGEERRLLTPIDG